MRSNALDHVRKLLVFEPRGHADMYGCFVVEPNDDGRGPRRRLLPQRGLLDRVRARDDRARHVGARRGSRRAAGGGEPRRRRRPVRPPRDGGRARRTDASGRCGSGTSRRSSGPRGSSSASARWTSRSAVRSTRRSRSASSRQELPRLIELGRRLKREVEEWQDVVHPLEPELRDIYGVIFWQEEDGNPLTQRNVTVFADGEVDRSPCGSGTSARLALLDRSRDASAGRGAAPPEHRRLGVPRPRGRRRRGRGASGGDHRGRGQRLPDGRARLHARPGRSARRGVSPPLALAEEPQDLAVVGESAGCAASRRRGRRRRGRRTAPSHPAWSSLRRSSSR